MIAIGPIKKPWEGKRLLIAAYPDDNSAAIKSIWASDWIDGTGNKHIAIGKETKAPYRRLRVTGVEGVIHDVNGVWLGVGCWIGGRYV